jgi:Raf kinase inhibitor-like YbhB/YbcL family protein
MNQERNALRASVPPWFFRILRGLLIFAVFTAPAGAFDVEPAAPTVCDDLVLLVTRTINSDCGYRAISQIQKVDSDISVSLELVPGGAFCLPVVVEKTFRVFLGPLPAGAYAISVSWTDLDQAPEMKEVIVDDAVCPEKISRGDANRDHAVDLGDAVFLLFHLFAGGPAPSCEPAADADADGSLGISDVIAVLGFLFLSGPALAAVSSADADSCRAAAPFTITSAAFADGETIPIKYSCDGSNVSPPLAWTGAPAGAKSFALTCLDPDAGGTFVHWLAWDIPSGDSGLAEGGKPPVEGTNGANRVGYTGPCPPRGGGIHHYVFTLHALDVETLSLPTSTKRAALEAALTGHVLGTAKVTGLYSRN